MADNYLDYHYEEFLAKKAKKEKARKARLRRYLAAYKERKAAANTASEAEKDGE